MRFCRRCHTLSKTNSRGFCKDCEDYIDQDIASSRRELERMQEDASNNIGCPPSGKMETFTEKALRIVLTHQKYYAWGYWVLPELQKARTMVLNYDTSGKLYNKINFDWREFIPYILGFVGVVAWFAFIYFLATRFYMLFS